MSLTMCDLLQCTGNLNANPNLKITENQQTNNSPA